MWLVLKANNLIIIRYIPVFAFIMVTSLTIIICAMWPVTIQNLFLNNESVRCLIERLGRKTGDVRPVSTWGSTTHKSAHVFLHSFLVRYFNLQFLLYTISAYKLYCVRLTERCACCKSCDDWLTTFWGSF